MRYNGLGSHSSTSASETRYMCERSCCHRCRRAVTRSWLRLSRPVTALRSDTTTAAGWNPSPRIVLKLIIAISTNQWSHCHSCCVGEEASGTLWLSRDLYIFSAGARHGINMLQAAHISLWAQQGREGRGGERGREDGMMIWLCKALGGRSRVWTGERDATKGERRREKFWVWRRSQECSRGLHATWTAAQADRLLIQWIYNECSFILLFPSNLSLLLNQLYLTSLLPLLLSPSFLFLFGTSIPPSPALPPCHRLMWPIILRVKTKSYMKAA